MSEAKADTPKRWRRLAAFALRHVGTLAATLFAVGVIFQAVIRDRIALLGFIFYALPRPILLVIGAVATAAFFIRRKNKAAGIMMAAVFALGLWWLATCCTIGPGAITEKPEVRVAFWNTMHNRADFKEMLQTISNTGADIIGLVESPYDPKGWRDELPDHETIGNDSMKLFVRGKILNFEEREVLDVIRIFRYSVRISAGTFQVFLVDINANPFHDRSRAFAELEEMLAAYRGVPTIVMGDFNTPMESVHYRTLAEYLSPVRPAGFRETWPTIAPVLSLDQIWTSRDLTTLYTRKVYTMSSDHVALQSDLVTTPTQEKPND